MDPYTYHPPTRRYYRPAPTPSRKTALTLAWLCVAVLLAAAVCWLLVWGEA